MRNREMIHNRLAWAGIVLTTAIWASSLIFAKVIFVEITPIIFVALRYTLACPLLLVLVRGRKKQSVTPDVLKANRKLIVLAGVTGPFLSQALQYIGLSLTSAGETVILLNLSPVFAVVLAAVLIEEKITDEKIIGLVLATVGASLIVMNNVTFGGSVDLPRLFGDAVIIISTLLFALNGIVGKKVVKSVDSVSLTTYSTLSAVPFLWITGLLLEDVTQMLSLSLVAWAVIIWIAVVNTVLAFVLYYESMRSIEASNVQIALNLIAVWGVLMAVVLLNETLLLLQVIGGTLTVLGVIVAQLKRQKAPEDIVRTV